MEKYKHVRLRKNLKNVNKHEDLKDL